MKRRGQIEKKAHLACLYPQMPRIIFEGGEEADSTLVKAGGHD
jgi:hypothetical protein